ncbi:MAG: disulfide bond formation protein B [Gammaproteobacteria bacterium WSBS_2016_MAG_OTU1]
MTDKLRLSFLFAAGVCFTSLAIAYFYMERHLLLPPCPLCILDRIVVALMGACFLAMYFIRGVGRRILLIINGIFLSLGFIFAIRHIWLQYRPPDESGGCLSDSQAAETFIEVLTRAFVAEGDCGAVYWQFAGLSIPEQVLVLFIFFAALLTAQAMAVFRHE